MEPRVLGLPLAAPRTLDVLSWPLAGRFLRWRHARPCLQLVLLAAAAAVLIHGWFGPQVSPRNVATVSIWVHYRGLLVLALLAAGNLFCTACPFVLVRDIGRRIHAPVRHLPQYLRTKWVALGLFAAVLFAYEWLDLWASPYGTAWLVLGYFAAALVIDVTFRGAAFCKYLCPIGQYNFIASTMSPLEIQVRSADTCASCVTHDCLRGRREPAAPERIVQRGCELGLYLPAKVGSLDCTLCLDCVHACPHDNVALAVRTPGEELWDDRWRSGVGRLARRPDLAALAVLFVFGALLNAFGMVGPVYAFQARLAELLGTRSEGIVLAVTFFIGLVVVPGLLIALCAWATRVLVRERASLRETVLRYAAALVPLGFGIWIAHYGFHLLTGWLTIVPVVQSAARDAAGWALFGEPLWGWAGLEPGAVFPIEVGFVLLGALISCVVAQRISLADHPKRAVRATLPWAALVLALASAAIWVLSQPMEMRGTFLG